MYYSRHKQKGVIINSRYCLFAFLILLLSSSIVIPVSYADFKFSKKTSEEYRVLGREEQEKGNLEGALSFYFKALSLGEEDAALHNDIAVVSEQLGFDEKAQEHYLKSLNLDPEYLPIYTNLGYFYKKMGMTGKAREYFSKRYHLGNPADEWTQQAKMEWIKLDPVARRQFVIEDEALREERKLIAAREQFQQSVAKAHVLIQAGKVALDERNPDLAIQYYEQALALTPGNPKALYGLSVAKAMKNIEDMKARITIVELDSEKNSSK